MDAAKENSKKSKSIFWDRFTFVAFVLFVVAGICLTVSIYFQKKYFDYFFVNGQSMYPTLNLHATHKNGVEYKELGTKLEDGSQHVDYGFYDTHESAINSIKRFDIVICKYFDNDQDEKIKRVIVMPGETFYIDTSVGNNGKLYLLNNSGEYKYVEQPIDPSKGNYDGYEEPRKLGKNEYFVMGDNRNHSTDSRTYGPIKKEYIAGKVVGLVGECTIQYSGSNPYPVEISYYSPRFF